MESSITRALFLVKKKKKTNEEVSVCGLLVRFTSCHFYRSGRPDSIQKGSLNLLQMTSAVGRRAGEKNRSTRVSEAVDSIDQQFICNGT